MWIQKVETPRAEEMGGNQEWFLKGAKVPFWGDKKILELIIVMIVQSC